MDRNDTPIKVLLIDDEVSYVTVLSKRMAKRDIEAVPVNSGKEAIQALRENEFDVALLDLKMEHMDGLEVLKVFRMIDPAIQVIILTGHGGEAEAREAMKLGAFDYLVKPCELNTIIRKIQLAAQLARKERKAP